MRYAENHENMPCKRCGVIHPYLTKFCVPIEHDQVVKFNFDWRRYRSLRALRNFRRLHKPTTWGQALPDYKWVEI